MAVAQIPRRDLFEKHGAVIRLGILHQTGILFGVEQFIFSQTPVAPHVVGRPALHLKQLTDDLLLTRLGKVQSRHQAIALGVLPDMIEAGVTLACPLGRLRVDLFEIAQHGFHRRVQAVEVEAIKPDFFGARRERVVVRS